VVKDRNGATLRCAGVGVHQHHADPRVDRETAAGRALDGGAAAADALGYRDFITVNVVVDRAHVFPDQWIYVHDPGVKVGRIGNFKEFSVPRCRR